MKRIFIFLFLMNLFAFAEAQNLWSVNNETRDNIITDKAVARLTYPKVFKLFNLNTESLRQELFSIAGANALRHSTVITLPNADGNMEQFEVFEASNFEPALQARFPEIRAFSGKGITDPYATLKLSISPQGIQTMVFRTDKENEFIEPYSKDHTVYSVFRSQREKGGLAWTCSTDDKKMMNDINLKGDNTSSATGGSTGLLKTMRLAQSCNGEYANYFGATSSAQVGLVLAAYNATLTRCNGVYEKDLALHLNLIAQTTNVIYYNPSTDPYTTLGNWNGQLLTTLKNNIGDANFDIGHMFGASGGGGNAGCIGCVCSNGTTTSTYKGAGITSPADGIPQGDNFDIDYVVHEVGHQLGGNHTFSMSLEGTGVNKEVGSGITIMGYAGITSQDVAPHSIDIFHETTIAQIQANLATKTCPVSTNITANNVAPVIGAVSNYTIPISTPFALTGSASDANGDALTYCWEQNDNSTTTGASSVASPTKATGPNWLSFSPVASGTRSFPRLSTILAGLNVTPPLPGGDAGANIEALSSVSRTLNFRLTVRDNHAYSSTAPVAVGQTAFTDVVVTVSNTSGPFAVTSPNTAVNWAGGSTQNITWNVNNTTVAPVGCANVNILLSTDGGLTFPTVLAVSTPNDGAESLVIPVGASTTARIKIEAVGNIFFDISNTNFTIGGAIACGDATGLTASAIGDNTATVSWNAVANAISYAVDYKLNSSGTWTSLSTAQTVASADLTGLTEGSLYDWRVKATCASGSGNFVAAQFTTTAPFICNAPTGLVSSAITSSNATVSWGAVGGAVSYDVDYKLNSSGTWINSITGTVSTSTGISGLTASSLYDWRVRTNCASGSSGYTGAQFTTTAVSTCPGSYDVSTNGTTAGAATIPLNTDVKGLIEVRGDNDHYKFIITTGGTITLSLTTLPADYQLALLSSTGTVLQSSVNNGTADETINRTVTAGTFYARVYPKNNGAFNAGICYTLSVQTGTAGRGNEMIQFSGNQFSVFPNPVGYIVNLGFNAKLAGNAVISIINQTGAVVLNKTLSVNEGDNIRKLDVGSLANGMYFIKIQNGADVQMAKIAIKK
ncbi:MAG: reprolysin-like metallopeptidase [Ferruginibacter sp.]